MITVTLYGRKDCHLCEQAKEDLAALQEKIPHKLQLVDIDTDSALQRRYGLEIPVAEIGPFTLKAPFTRQELQVTLGAAQDRERHIEQIENSPQLEEVRQGGVWTKSDRITDLIANHYMAFFNLLVLVYLGLACLAPTLMKVGAPAPAGLLYKAFSLVCHQLAYRSFFLYGEQLYYPRAAAGIEGVQTFEQATGLSEGSDAADLFAAREFVGNETVGYKIALCQRDVGIYGGILLFGLIFAATGMRLREFPWYLWILLGVVPIALDGFSQLLSQPPLSFFPYRESTPALRFLTGLMFGFFTAWFGYPLVEESMSESRRIMAAKRRRIFGA